MKWPTMWVTHLNINQMFFPINSLKENAPSELAGHLLIREIKLIS